MILKYSDFKEIRSVRKNGKSVVLKGKFVVAGTDRKNNKTSSQVTLLLGNSKMCGYNPQISDSGEDNFKRRFFKFWPR